MLSRCYYQLRQWGQEEGPPVREEDAERKLGHDEPGESEGLPGRYISRPQDRRVWHSRGADRQWESSMPGGHGPQFPLQQL